MAGEILNYLDSVESFVELVGDVKLVCVEKKNDSVNSLGEPSENLKLDLKRKHVEGFVTFEKSYPRLTRCFSPDKIPGESMIEIESKTGLSI